VSRSSFLALLCAVCCAPVASAQGSKTSSLSGSEKLILAPEGKRAFDDQLRGASGADGLGTILPRGVPRDEVLSLVVPPGLPPEHVTLVGAVPWKGHPGALVAVVCVGGTSSTGLRVCDDGRAWLAVLERRDGRLAVVARMVTPFTPRSDWSSMGDDGPAQSSDPGSVEDEEIGSFDLAPFLVAEGDLAFGVRTAHHEGYGGGFGYFESLHLFHVVGDRLDEILGHPIYAMTNSAGEWHEDGTRDHTVTERRLVVVVERALTHGFHDLTIRDRGARTGGFVARWDAAQGRYRVQAK